METLKFDFPFERHEWVRASRAILIENIRRRWWIYGAVILAFAALGVFAIIDNLKRGVPLSDAFAPVVPCVGLPASWIAVVYFVRPWRASGRIARRHRASPGQTTRVITETGIKVVAPGVTQDLEWRAIPRVVETRDFFLFFASGSAAYFLPKRLMSDGQVGQLRALLQGALPADRLKLLPSAA